MEVKKVIRIKSMSFKYKDEYLFKNFDLDIDEGTFVSIIGKNGSGKSTLAKILVGLLDYEGYVNVSGYLLNSSNLKKIRRSLSAVFDNADIHFIGETVTDDLAFSLENLFYTKEEIEKSIENISKKFKLEKILEKSPEELTDSEKEKVAIASSLIHNPKILLLDESIHKLTPADKKLVFKLLKEYQGKEKLTIILITHNLEDTLISDRIIVLDKGKLILDNTKEEIYKNDKLEKLGFTLPFMVKLSHNLILYDLIDEVYFNMGKLADKLWP